MINYFLCKQHYTKKGCDLELYTTGCFLPLKRMSRFLNDGEDMWKHTRLMWIHLAPLKRATPAQVGQTGLYSSSSSLHAHSTLRAEKRYTVALWCSRADDGGVADQTILSHNAADTCCKRNMYVQICAQRDHGAHTHTAETACFDQWSRKQDDIYGCGPSMSSFNEIIFWIISSRYNFLHALLCAQKSAYNKIAFKIPQISPVNDSPQLTCGGTHIPAAIAASVCLLCWRVCSWKLCGWHCAVTRSRRWARLSTSALPAAFVAHFTRTRYEMTRWRGTPIYYSFGATAGCVNSWPTD
jgi:hypothetical protein